MGLDITQILNFDQLNKTGQDSGNKVLSKNTSKQSKVNFNQAAYTTTNEED